MSWDETNGWIFTAAAHQWIELRNDRNSNDYRGGASGQLFRIKAQPGGLTEHIHATDAYRWQPGMPVF